MSKWCSPSLVVFLGLFFAFSSRCSASVGFSRIAITSPGGSLPPYVAHCTLVFPAPTGQDLSKDLTVQVNLGDTWNQANGTPVSAETASALESLQFNPDVGGYARDVNPTTLPLAYGTTAQLTAPAQDGGNSPAAIIPSPCAPYMIGLTLIKVHDGAGQPIPNAVVTVMNYSRDVYGAGWDLQYPSFSSGHMTLGQGLFSSGDHSYPPGLASDHYLYVVSASGFASCHAYFPTGIQSGGQTVDVVLMPSGQSSPITVSPTTAADNPDVAPVAATSGTGSALDLSTLNNFVGSFFDKLKSALVDLFTPSQADLDAVHVAATNLFTWGPFGLPAIIKSAWDASGSDYGLTNSDPKYWYFPLSMGSLTPYAIMSTPTGYTPGADPGLSSPNNRSAARAVMSGQRVVYQAAHFDAYGRPLRPSAVTTATTSMDINMWQALIPDHWDCRPYSSAILVMRGLMWAGAWISFAVYLRNKFTPSLRI